jgi:hypothetical protein
MPRLSVTDIASALYGLFRLFRLDRDGFDYFETTPAGLLKSFWVAAALLPIYVLYLALDLALLDVASVVNPVRYVLVELTAYVVDWVAFPLLMLTLAPVMGLDHRLFRFLVPLNWIQLPLGVLMIVPGLLARLADLPDQAISFMGLTIISAALIITAALARHGLDLPWWSAAGMTVLNFILSLFITSIAYSMTGGG